MPASQTMLLTRNHNERESIINVYANNVLLEQVQNYKHLGIYLDPKLNFDFYIEKLSSKSKQKLSSFGCVRKYITRETAFILYRSLLLPVLDYCSIVYMTSSKNSLRKVQKIQNSACRIILFAER